MINPKRQSFKTDKTWKPSCAMTSWKYFILLILKDKKQVLNPSIPWFLTNKTLLKKIFLWEISMTLFWMKIIISVLKSILVITFNQKMKRKRSEYLVSIMSFWIIYYVIRFSGIQRERFTFYRILVTILKLILMTTRLKSFSHTPKTMLLSIILGPNISILHLYFF